MQLSSLLVAALAFGAVSATGIAVAKRAELDINQKVYIEGQPVLGDGVGESILNTCQDFAAMHVSNPSAPEVRVCGTGIKATVFLRGRCEGYYQHSVTVGKCDSGMPSTTCDSFSPANDERFGTYQSYIVEQC